MKRTVFKRYLTVAEEKLLFSCVKQFQTVYARRDYAWMRLLRHTGIRVTALSKLTVCDAQLALNTSYLQLRSDIQKRQQAHTVFLTKKARQAFNDLLKVHREMAGSLEPEAVLIVSRNHKGICVRQLQKRMEYWRKEAGLDVKASPHWFRHTLAKRIISQSEARNPGAVVQGVLGHADPRSTAVYTTPDREEIEQAMEKAS